MGIDFSTQTDEWWSTTFERYITGGNSLGTIAEGGWESIKRYFESCLPIGDYPDREILNGDTEWRVRGTHPRVGPFSITIQKVDRSWVFEWE